MAGILYFIEADWPLIGGDFPIRAVDVMWPKKLDSKLASNGQPGTPLCATSPSGSRTNCRLPDLGLRSCISQLLACEIGRYKLITQPPPRALR